MPRYHFTVESDAGSAPVGSIDLPGAGAAFPTGFDLTLGLLARLAKRRGRDQQWTVQVADDAGRIVLDFKVTVPGEGGAFPGSLH